MARLLFLTSSYPSTADDGVCGYVHDLAASLAARHGHTVRVVAPAAAGHADDAGFAPVRIDRFRYAWPAAPRYTADRDAGAAFGASPGAKLEAASFVAAFAQSASRLARNADAIVSHWLAPAGMVGAMLRRSGRPHVAIAHGGDVHMLARLPGGRHVVRWQMRRTDAVACAARWQIDVLAGLAGRALPDVRHIPMGAAIGVQPNHDEIEAFRSAHGLGGGPSVLFLGRLVPIKGVDVLLEAAMAAPGAAIWIAGDGPDYDRLRGRAEAARLRVSFLGRLARGARRLALEACDAVVVPSIEEPSGRQEGAPVVVAEALAAGRPVIASRTGEIPGMLDDGHNALLVSPGDAAELAAALSRVASEPDLVAQLTEAARASGRRFTMDTTADAIAELLANALDAHARRTA